MSDNITIKDWADLARLPDSETHCLRIDVENGNGWIKDKRDPQKLGKYLSTHSFYGTQHERTTSLLRASGWNVTCANWDDPKE